MVFPKFSDERILQAKTFAAEDGQKYIMYIVKSSGERTFVTGSTKKELADFAERQNYRQTRIVLAPKRVAKSSPFTMENRRKKWEKRWKK